MSYKLFLDDQRGCPQGWVLASNYTEFVKIITEKGVPDVIAFDHDLGDGGEVYEEGVSPWTGWNCAKWLVDNNLVPKEFSVHSWNPSGAQRIGLLMEENGSKKIRSPYPYISSF